MTSRALPPIAPPLQKYGVLCRSTLYNGEVLPGGNTHFLLHPCPRPCSRRAGGCYELSDSGNNATMHGVAAHAM